MTQRSSVSCPDQLHEFAQQWADHDNRTLGSVLALALELGLRQAMRDGLAPQSAVISYHSPSLVKEQPPQSSPVFRETIAPPTFFRPEEVEHIVWRNAVTGSQPNPSPDPRLQP